MDLIVASGLVVALVVALFLLGDRALEARRRRELGGWLIDEVPADARVDARLSQQS